MTKQYEVINLLGQTIATFKNKNEAHNFADNLINYAYVQEVKA